MNATITYSAGEQAMFTNDSTIASTDVYLWEDCRVEQKSASPYGFLRIFLGGFWIAAALFQSCQHCTGNGLKVEIREHFKDSFRVNNVEIV